MIKVLLLDDEQLALEYLETIVDWKRCGFEIIGRLTDARQALKVFRRERPELIVSDICMVGMDGVDFAAAVRDIDQGAHILFLSGYKNFDYVQRAIRLGIDDYLLKSDINQDIFLDKLVQIKHKIQREHHKTRYTETAVFREIFEKGVEEKAYREMMSEQEYLRLHKRFYFMACCVKCFPDILLEYLPGMDAKWYIDEEAVRGRIAQAVGDDEIGLVAAFRLDETRMLAILEAPLDTVSEKESFEYFYRAIRRLFDDLNGAGRLLYDLFYARERYTVREFGRLFQRVQGQLAQVCVHREPRIYEFRSQPAPAIADGAPSVDRLYAAVEQDQAKTLDEVGEAFRVAIGSEDAQGYLQLLRVCLETFARVEKARMSDDSSRCFNLAENSERYDFFNPEDVAGFVTDKLEEAAELYRRDTGVAYSKSIQTALATIRDNLGVEDLSAGMIARQVNLSPSWLSAKFKEEVGVGISEYLNSMRIQKARQLLSETDDMIYEVSEQCGFASSQYFSKIFKQLTGMTPNEYRRKKR